MRINMKESHRVQEATVAFRVPSTDAALAASVLASDVLPKSPPLAVRLGNSLFDQILMILLFWKLE